MNLHDLWFATIIRDHLFETDVREDIFMGSDSPSSVGHVVEILDIPDEAATVLSVATEMRCYDDDGILYFTCLAYMPCDDPWNEAFLDAALLHFGRGWGVTRLEFPYHPEWDAE